MGEVLKLIWCAVIGLFRSRASLEAEILALRHQLTVLRRKAPKMLAFSSFDRLFFASLYRIAPGVVNALVIVKPETVIRWHRAGFRFFWRWKSRHRGGRPKVPLEIRQLNREMSLANPLGGAPESETRRDTTGRKNTRRTCKIGSRQPQTLSSSLAAPSTCMFAESPIVPKCSTGSAAKHRYIPSFRHRGRGYIWAGLGSLGQAYGADSG